jgi:hypothetical protein
MPILRSFVGPAVATVAILLSSHSPASTQGATETVVPGRDFHAQKLLTPGLTDTWKLDVAAGEMLWCVVDSSSFDPVLELVDDTGTVLGSDDGAGTRSELWLRAPRAGAYAFRVSPFQNSGGGNYSYFLHRFRTESLGRSAEASHTFGKELWWHYRVTLREGDVLVPTVLGDGRLTAVIDPDRKVVDGLHGGYRARHAGDHFVRIEGREHDRCQVMTQLARSGERALDASHQERIAPYGLDTWRFRLPAGACIVVDLAMAEALLDFDVRETQPTDQGPAFVATGHFDKGGRKRRLYFVRADSQLELHLRHQGSLPAGYELAVRCWGETKRAGERIDGTMPLGNGVLFHLPLLAGDLLDVTLASDAFDARLDVWDPQGRVIASGDDRGLLDRTAFHRLLVTQPGTYHVLAYSNGASGSGAYSLYTQSNPVPRLEFGQPVKVQGGHHLHLDLQAGAVVWLSLRSTAFDGALQVVDPAGDAGFVAEGGGIGSDVLVAYRASHTGRHTLLVHARSGNGDGEVKVVLP